MSAYYNENDPKAAAWLRELIKENLIAPGEVDERSIEDVDPNDLEGFAQCHFFAGIGGWSYALRLAGWPDSREVWTGSCPCQPFSDAGAKKANKDERHLWPIFRELVRTRKPSIAFGEQVASRLGREWLAGVFADLEAMGYQRAAADLCSAGVSSPNRRQRLYWMAYGDGERFSGRQKCHCESKEHEKQTSRRENACRCSSIIRMDDARLPKSSGRSETKKGSEGNSRNEPSSSSEFNGMGNANRSGHALRTRFQRNDEATIRSSTRKTVEQTIPWKHYAVLLCQDGKLRRFEPSAFPLVNGIPGRVGLLRGYGNAIVPQVAAEFIKAAEEAITLL